MAIIKTRGVFVYILLEIYPDVYGPYVITDRKGFKKLIFQCQNVIYGTITASLLYYKNYRMSIEYEGYEFNPHDLCVSKNTIKGIHMTVCFHVDD